jgi:hypothetical protein
MFKRSGAFAPISLAIATAALMALTAGTVTAKASKSTTLDETSPCHFTVTYSYSSLGHGNDVTVHVALFRQEAGTTNQTLVSSESFPGFSGNGAAIIPVEFSDSGQTGSFQYIGVGYITAKAPFLIARSQAWSELTPTPETCA